MLFKAAALATLFVSGGASSSTIRGWTSSRGKNLGVLSSSAVSGLCDDTVNSESGYFKVSGSKNTNYFYWYFESKNDPENAPLIMWLTGGPGCSSVLALFAENGPCSVNKDGTGTIPNPYSWNTNANIFWIDQPAGVGFSYGDKSDYASNEADVAEDLYQFLQAFFEANPKLLANNFYVFGESYGGHYAPATAHRIFQANRKNEGLKINLAGLGVGNGLTDPEIQYAYYPQMAYNNTYGIKAVSEATYDQMLAAVPRCVSMIQRCQKSDAACGLAQDYCNAAVTGGFQQSGLNVYDVRIKCEVPGLCYDFSNVEKYLANPDVLEALHVSPEASVWESCNMEVNKAFKRDFLKNYQQTIPPMLEAGINVLIYAGDADFICNFMGNEAWTLALDWKGQRAFTSAPTREWTAELVAPNGTVVESKAGGVARTADGFTFLRVYGAGHMVPMDQPAVALAMLDNFISGKGF